MTGYGGPRAASRWGRLALLAKRGGWYRLPLGGLKVLGRVLLLPAHAASGWLPRDPNLWLLGAWHGAAYADNPRWLGNTITATAPDIRAVWMSRNAAVLAQLRDQGIACAHPASPRGMWLRMRAGALVYSHTPRCTGLWLTRGALRVNTWHGTPSKKIGLDEPYTAAQWGAVYSGSWWRRILAFLAHPPSALRPHALVCDSPVSQRRFQSAFALSADRVWVCGNGKVDALLDPARHPFLAGEAAALGLPDNLPSGAGPVALYAPTFRDHHKVTDSHDVDWQALLATLRETDGHLFVKPHPYDVADFAVPNDPHITLLGGRGDVYPFLHRVDVLLGEYSSVPIDFSVLGRSIVWLVDDIEAYRADARALYEPFYPLQTTGVAATPEQLATKFRAAMRSARQNPAFDATPVREAFHTHRDGRNGERLIVHIRAALRNKAFH